MNILIAGALGFIGRHLINNWSEEHQITALGRDKLKLQRCFPENITCYQWDELEQINAKDIEIVINLCGYNIGERRWSDYIKQKIINSRVQTTKS